MKLDPIAVPHQWPLEDPGSIRLAIVGESPGLEECNWHTCAQGHGFSTRYWDNRVLVTRSTCPQCGNGTLTPAPTPFVGPSGRLLNHLLGEAALPRDRVWVGNVSRVPLEGDAKDDPTNALVQAGLGYLARDLERFRPHCVLALGNLALRALHPRGAACSISDYRGSLFTTTMGHKAVAAFHPANVLHEPSQLALLRFDLQRAVKEANTPDLNLPVRVYDVALSHADLVSELGFLREHGSPVAVDIEGTVQSGISVIGFSDGSGWAFTVPLRHVDWRPVWSPEQETALWSAMRSVLECPTVVKVFHNAVYDMFVLRWLHAIKVWPVEDTMIEWSVLYPELEKALSVVASILTRGDYWKDGLHAEDDHGRDTYCAQDACRTLECHLSMQSLLSPAQRTYYQTQVALLEPVLDMMTQGMAYDSAARDRLHSDLTREVQSLQGELDLLAGIKPPNFAEVVSTVTRKVKAAQCSTWPDVVRHAKPSFLKPLPKL